MLTRIMTQDVEPTNLDVRLGPRLNLLCGDNGLGKTFLLELAWWVLTGTWSVQAVLPKRGNEVSPAIGWEIDEQPAGRQFDFASQEWGTDRLGKGLVIYANADGGLHVWDSGSELLKRVGWTRRGGREIVPFALSSREVWEGLSTKDGTVLCNGLIRDWVAWQYQRPELFALLTRVLAKLSPDPSEVLRPGAPKRVSLEDARDIPTIDLPYGNVPVTHASAGMRRILALAYVLVWVWHEHTEAARLKNTAPVRKMTLLIDEVDAHLHPRWQRAILPSLFDVIHELEASLNVQVLASTHAPLVVASVEPLFEEEEDKLLHFGLSKGSIVVEEVAWSKQGDAASWLVSEAFGLSAGKKAEASAGLEAKGEQRPRPRRR